MCSGNDGRCEIGGHRGSPRVEGESLLLHIYIVKWRVFLCMYVCIQCFLEKET